MCWQVLENIKATLLPGCCPFLLEAASNGPSSASARFLRGGCLKRPGNRFGQYRFTPGGAPWLSQKIIRRLRRRNKIMNEMSIHSK
jgi:hypothetical protein